MNFFRRWILRGSLRKAVALESQGRFAEAKSLYEAAVEVHQGRDRVHALSHAGLCNLALGLHAEARKHLEEAVKLAPEDATAWLNYGRISQELGDSIKADEAYQKANELAPNRPDILYHLASYYAGKFTRAALEAAKRAARVTLEFLEKPGGPAALQALGFPAELPLVLIRNLGLEWGDPEACADALRELVGRTSSPPTRWARPAALNHLGLLLANTGKYEKAMEAYHEALQADSTILPARFNLALVLARIHKTDEAERELRIYAEHHKGSPVVAFAYATIAEHRGNADDAVRHFRGAMERHERQPVNPAVLARLDVPRKWMEYAKRFVATITGEEHAEEDGQWVGPQGD